MQFGLTTVKTTYIDGKPTIIHNNFEERHRVKDDKQELGSFMQFRDIHKDDDDLSFRIEKTKTGVTEGFYYVVWCWTVKQLG